MENFIRSLALQNVSPKKVLSLFALVMINVIAVDSLRTLPFSASFGTSIIFYYAVCAILFLIPVALATAELATTWPKNGGIYVWVKEAFGDRMGFLVIWLQWVSNVIWFPSVLGAIAVIAAHMFAPSLENSNVYTLIAILGFFYLATAANCFGMQFSSIISSIGSLLGTLLPMAVIILFGAYWFFSGEPLGIKFTAQDMLPKIDSINDVVLITAVLFGLIGIEMSAVHASEVHNPEKNYPKALMLSVVIILFSLILSSLAIAIVIPAKQMNIVTGMLLAFEIFFNKLDVAWMIPVITILMIIGVVASVATWIIGPTKGLLAAAKDDLLPTIFAHTSSKGAPIPLLILQAIVVTIISGAYILLPSVEAAYIVLTQQAAILGLIMYILLFAALIKLRYSHSHIKRPYQIPGGKSIVWTVGGIGIITCAAAALLGLLPPSQVDVGNARNYQVIMILGVAVFCLPAYFIHRLHGSKNK
jgi:amino acid transporter